jgi:Spy/CpxP family protein refolding chaperone
MRALIWSLLAITLLPRPARCEEPLRDPFEGMYNPKRLLHGARLTEAQLAQIREIRRPTRAKEIELEHEIDRLNGEWADRFTSEAPLDAPAIIAIVDKVEGLQKQMELLKAQNLVKMRAVLTKEQLAHVAAARRAEREIDWKLRSLDEQRRALEAQRRTIGPTIAGETGL